MSLAPLQLGTPAHRTYVCRLYRKSLRLAADWYWQRRECREKQVMIRAMFDGNKNESNPRIVAAQLREAEKALAYYFHPIPYICKLLCCICHLYLRLGQSDYQGYIL